jgi:hypothetical protein
MIDTKGVTGFMYGVQQKKSNQSQAAFSTQLKFSLL